MRADKFLAERFGSRSRACAALKEGRVLRNGTALSPSDEVVESDPLTFLSDVPEFVSRGGYKLERALSFFREDVSGQVFADLGASTGGFTEVLLLHGAAHVYSVDVGKAQLAPSLASDERVSVMDERNARFLTASDFPEPLDGIVSDLSFISLRLVLPVIRDLLGEKGRAFVLFKPQFECGGTGLGKGGILPARYHKDLLDGFFTFCCTQSLAPRGIVNAPVLPRKNIEYVVFLEKNGTPLSKDEFLRSASTMFEGGKIF